MPSDPRRRVSGRDRKDADPRSQQVGFLAVLIIMAVVAAAIYVAAHHHR